MNLPPQPSRDMARFYLSKIDHALRAVHSSAEVPPTAVVWPAGLDRRILRSLPLSVRTYNCLTSAKLMEGSSLLKAEDLLHLPNFGVRSLRDMLVNVATYLLKYARTSSIDEINTQTQIGSTLWDRTRETLLPLLATSVELLGTRTLADALHPDVLRLASRMGLAAELHAIRVHDVIERTQSVSSRIAARLEQVLETAPKRQQTIIQLRLVETPPATLRDVGRQLSITRERVRQIQVKCERRIKAALGKEIRIVAATLKDRLDPIVLESNMEVIINEIGPKGSFMAQALFRRFLLASMEFTLDSGFYIDGKAAEVLRDLRTGARSLADDVGLVHEQQLIATLPSEEWHRFWPWLRDRSGFHELHGTLALRDTTKARAKAALMSIGRSATRDEIAAVCGFQDSQTVGATLSNIPSVARADKERWGLREWIDDEYDGIIGEILQRIEEDGGSTTTERLLTELPKKFNVSPASVRAYMQTPRFETHDGSVSLADTSKIQLRHLDDVIHGRDDSGAPYWTFVVEGRYFEGYSVVGVPPEFAKSLGCKPDSSIGVHIENVAGCRELSLRWRLASLTGASLGYLSEPLHKLGLRPGDRARVTIKGMRMVALNGQSDETQTHSPGMADATLERILRRRRMLP